tara:strand:- start:78 stop:377 length:300 start_codon:yes stop_codon:yes gene_type:complete
MNEQLDTVLTAFEAALKAKDIPAAEECLEQLRVLSDRHSEWEMYKMGRVGDVILGLDWLKRCGPVVPRPDLHIFAKTAHKINPMSPVEMLAASLEDDDE